MPHVHFLGDVGAAEINQDLTRGELTLCQYISRGHDSIQLQLHPLVFNPYIEEAVVRYFKFLTHGVLEDLVKDALPHAFCIGEAEALPLCFVCVEKLDWGWANKVTWVLTCRGYEHEFLRWERLTEGFG